MCICKYIYIYICIYTCCTHACVYTLYIYIHILMYMSEPPTLVVRGWVVSWDPRRPDLY